MTLYRVDKSNLERIDATSFEQESLRERQDLQRLLRTDISVLDPDPMVIAEEYSGWIDSARRVDLLCLDRDAQLVVVELKRTGDGGHAELQALRYAGMVSAMTYSQLVDIFARQFSGASAREDAETRLRQFLSEGSQEDPPLSGKVRVILVSADFSKELMTTVLWLNRNGLDIECFRATPYKFRDDVLLDIQQLIPLPEAADYETQLRAQQNEQDRETSDRKIKLRTFWSDFIARGRPTLPLLETRNTSSTYFLTLRLPRKGFFLYFFLLRSKAGAELLVDFGESGRDVAKTHFESLREARSAIEAEAGSDLEWIDHPSGYQFCIRRTFENGWRTPENEWPSLQDAMLGTAVRLERALRDRIPSKEDSTILP